MSEFRNTQATKIVPTVLQEAAAPGPKNGGFNYDNCKRNDFLLNADNGAVPNHTVKFQKTGTTICGVVYKDGIVLGADTRATGGSIVMDKNCEKIHYITPNIYCCGAGTAADTENVTGMIASEMELLRMSTGTESRVVTAVKLLKHKLFQYQGHLGAALVLGGVDVKGAHLYTVYPHGSTDKLPYVTMGSGSLAAMSVFEAGYKDDMTEQEAINLVDAAIDAGIFNDLGSGSNVDITIIRRVDNQTTVDIKRNYRTPNEGSDLRSKIDRDHVTHIPRGATVTLDSKFVPMAELEVTDGAAPMQL